MGIKGLNSQLQEICKYLQMVVDEKLPINHQIIYQLQDVFNLLPDVQLQEFVKSVYVKTNDQMLVVRYPKTITCGKWEVICFENKRQLLLCTHATFVGVSKTAEVEFEFITQVSSEATAAFCSGSGRPSFSLFVDICK